MVAGVAVIGFIVGVLNGEVGAYRRNCDEQRLELIPILQSDPAFIEVTVAEECDGGWVFLVGSVPTQPDRWRLQYAVTNVIGKRRAEHAVASVQVKQSSKP